MLYAEYKEQRQKEFDELPIFWAFSNEQFEDEMAKRGLTIEDTDKVYRFGNGGFYLKSDAPILKAFFDKEDDLPGRMENDLAFAEDAFYYEMCNHEYGINWQGDWDVCSCFANCEYEEGANGNDYLRQAGYSEKVIAAYLVARAKYIRAAKENDWF